jgi:hypothetical protein
MSLVRRLRDEERWAQVCIQHSLPDCTVEPHDDCSRPSMYDLKTVYPDGSIGAVEVTAAADGVPRSVNGGSGSGGLRP